MNDFDDVVSSISCHAFVIQHLAQRHHHLVDDLPVFDGDVTLQIAAVGGEAEAARQMAQHVRVQDGSGDRDLVVGGSQGFTDGDEPDIAEHQHGARLRIVSHQGTLKVGEENVRGMGNFYVVVVVVMIAIVCLFVVVVVVAIVFIAVIIVVVYCLLSTLSYFYCCFHCCCYCFVDVVANVVSLILVSHS